MKRIVLLICLALMIPLSMAQHHSNNRPPRGNSPQSNHYQNQTVNTSLVLFIAENNETFFVSVDGRNVNSKARRMVMVTNLSCRPHNVQITLKRPTSERINLQIHPQMGFERYRVSFDERNQKLMVIPMYETHHHPNQGPQPPTQILPPAPLVCTPEEVRNMCQSISRESFDNDRLDLAMLIVKSSNKLFKTSQIREMVRCFSSSSSKLKFFKFAYDYCVDPSNYYECVNDLSFNSDKENLLAFLNSRPQPNLHQPQLIPPGVPHAPMVCTSEEVNDMCQSISREPFDDNRLDLAKLIVKSSNKMFTASQIKQMARCFSFDNAKVKFLEFAYDYCVDPNNYYECVNVLTFSSGKDELMRFLNSRMR